MVKGRLGRVIVKIRRVGESGSLAKKIGPVVGVSNSVGGEDWRTGRGPKEPKFRELVGFDAVEVEWWAGEVCAGSGGGGSNKCISVGMGSSKVVRSDRRWFRWVEVRVERSGEAVRIMEPDGGEV